MPHVQFCSAQDGKRIAFAVDGDGPAIVLPAWWISHVQKDWEQERFRAFFAALAEHRQVVRYDRIGAGLSDREREDDDITVEREVGDLTTVIDHLGLDKVTLFGISCGGPTAVTYAARHPKRIHKLIFYASYLRGESVGTSSVQTAVLDLVRASWGLGSKTIASLFVPDLSAADVRRSAALQRAWADGEMAAKLLKLTYFGDVASEAELVSVPSLIIHRQHDHAVPFDAGRELASHLPNATFLPLDGRAHVPWEGDTRPVLDAIFSFLGIDVDAEAAPGRTPPIPDNALFRTGDVWLLSFGGKQSHLKHSKGLSDIAVLLARPGEEIAAATLMGGGAEQLAATGGDDILDEKARAEFGARIRAIDDELEEARGFNDLGRVERIEQERDAIAHELAAATGLGGRRRKLKDPAERARKAVSARIRETIQRITEAHPQAGDHLGETIRTGAFCSYDPRRPVDWHT